MYSYCWVARITKSSLLGNGNLKAWRCCNATGAKWQWLARTSLSPSLPSPSEFLVTRRTWRRAKAMMTSSSANWSNDDTSVRRCCDRCRHRHRHRHCFLSWQRGQLEKEQNNNDSVNCKSEQNSDGLTVHCHRRRYCHRHRSSSWQRGQLKSKHGCIHTPSLTDNIP